MRLRSLVLSAALIVLPFPLLADTIYTYTGNPYGDGTTALPYFTASEFISGSFTVASPLGTNLALEQITPITFSFSDGYQTFLNTDSGLSTTFEIMTDGAGDITSWFIDLNRVGTNNVLITESGPSTGKIDIGQATVFSVAAGELLGYQAVVPNDPGTWSEGTPSDPSPVPEPSSFLLLGTGALGVIGSIRRQLLK